VYTQQWACTVEDDHAAQRNCTVVLQDARFATIDTRLVKFYTNATVYDSIPQLDGRATGTGAGPPQGGGDNSCSALCPNLMNVMCALLNFCWARLFEGLLIYALIAAVCYWALVKCGPCKLAATATRNIGQVGRNNEQHSSRAEPRFTPPKVHRSPLRLHEQQLAELEAELSNAELASMARPRSTRGGRARDGVVHERAFRPTRLEVLLAEAAREETRR
jgi:hypothetical protein